MEPNAAVRALYEEIIKKHGKAGAKNSEIVSGSSKWQIRELENETYLGLCDQSAKVRDYLLGHCSVTCALWLFKPGEEDSMSASFEAVAKGFDAGAWGYGSGKDLTEKVVVYFSCRGFSANSRLIGIVADALAFLSAAKIEETRYNQKAINPDGDYTEPPD